MIQFIQKSVMVVDNGAGGGKSLLGSLWLATQIASKPGSTWAMCRSELKKIKLSTLITFKKILKQVGFEEDSYRYDDQKGVFTFVNGCLVVLVDLFDNPSDPNYDRLGSTEYSGVFIDEGQEIDGKAKDILSSRIRNLFGKDFFYSISKEECENWIEQNGKGFLHYNEALKEYHVYEWINKPKMLITCNPGHNFIYTDFYKPKRNNTILPHRSFIQSLPKDNPFLPKDYITNLEKLNKVSRERLLYGNFDYDDDPSVLFEIDSLDRCFKDREKKYDSTYYLTVDVARLGKDRTVIGVWNGLYLERVKVIDRDTLTNQLEEINGLIKKYHIEIENVIVDEGGVGCLLPGTQVFTLNGWKNVKDIKIGDKIYSKNKDGKVIIDEVWANNIFEDQEIIKDKTGLIMSKGHLTPIKTRKEYNFKNTFWEDIIKKKRIILDNDFIWEGVDFNLKLEGSEVEMPNGGYRKYNNNLDIKGEDLAKFLGWFLSDGNLDIYGGAINISQKKAYNFNSIEESILSCGLTYNYVDKTDGLRKYVIHNRMLFEWIKNNCYNGELNCLDFKIPNIIKGGNRKIIENFLGTFLLGDGYKHKGTGKNYYCTSSIQLRDDLLELIYKKGGYGNYTTHFKKGSSGEINGRNFIRSRDGYKVYETKETSIGFKPQEVNRYYGTVYDLRLKGKTKLYPIRFLEGDMKGKMFWTHNGGLVDMLGCRGFIANASAINPLSAKLLPYMKRNYANLKTQAFFYLKQYIEEGKIGIYKDCEYKEEIIEEMLFIRQVDIDNDAKIKLESKKVLKDRLGRSPDFADMLSERLFWIIKKHGEGQTEIEEQIEEEGRELSEIDKAIMKFEEGKDKEEENENENKLEIGAF